ncbi:MAG: hybrid sensor histidine kinase/response regulator, partial [Gammaproteobacteria bacterium]|nr:hybrid sensor histidine kinase/response regulator [Gammaproteobacteria bacterium]
MNVKKITALYIVLLEWLSQFLSISHKNAPILDLQVQLFFKQVPSVIIAASIVATALSFAFYDTAGVMPAIIWALTVYLLTTVRFYSVYRYKISRQTDLEKIDNRFWSLWCTGFSILSGLQWGAAILLFFNPESMVDISILILLELAMIAAAVASLSVIPSAFVGYATPVALMMAYSLFFSGHSDFNILGVLVIVYLLAMYMFCKNIYKATIFGIRMSIENAELIENLQIEKDRAEKANKDKSRFLTATSHDLRQPLHALDLYLGALKNVLTKDEQRELLGKSQASSKALSELFNAIMDVSRLDAGMVSIDKQNVNLKLLLDEVYHSMQPHAESQKIALQIKSSDITVYSDPVLLGRIIRNLVSNAIKHSEGKNIKVIASADQNGVMLKVIDDGKGIVNTEIENIFSEFYQLNNPERNRAKGIGLGLAIVKRIASQLEHKISVSSELNKGSTFSIFLPVVNESEILKPEQVKNETFDFSGTFAIIIEDEAGVRDAMRLLLRSWDCEVLVGDSLAAINAELDQADYPVPDVIISDYRLRENKTGLDAIITLRERFAEIVPALVVTGDVAKDIA